MFGRLSLWHRITGRGIILTFLIMQLVVTAPPARAQDCTADVATAEQMYEIGDWTESIELLQQMLDRPEVDSECQKNAYRVIGMSYVAIEKEAEAKTAIRELLALVPAYEPDPTFDNPQYVKLVHEVRLDMDPDYLPPGEEEEKGGNIWTWVLVGAGAVVGAVLLIGGGGDEETPPPTTKDLPDPPELP